MNEIYDVEIKNGYRLEKDLKHEKMLDLVLYQNGQRKIVDSVPSISISCKVLSENIIFSEGAIFFISKTHIFS